MGTQDLKEKLVRYVDFVQERKRVYFLPYVPVEAGEEVESERGFDLEGAIRKFSEEKQERVRKIGERYYGRQLDAMSILLYAEEMGQFERYALRLEARPRSFSFIHPKLMARTDVTAFMLRMYADLGIASVTDAEKAEKFVDEYGAGVVVKKED